MDLGVLKPGAGVEYTHDFEGSFMINLEYPIPTVFRIPCRKAGGIDYAMLGASLNAA